MVNLTQVHCHRNEYIHPRLKITKFSTNSTRQVWVFVRHRPSSQTANHGQQTLPAQWYWYRGDHTEPTLPRQTVCSETNVQFSRARMTTPRSGMCVWLLKVCVLLCFSSACISNSPWQGHLSCSWLQKLWAELCNRRFYRLAGRWEER